MAHQIILNAFGTTTESRQTYSVMDARIAPHFQDSSIHWIFSSPTVRRSMRDKQGNPGESLTELLRRLAKDADSIVVQSLHVLPGHEFHRVVREARLANGRATVGMPLLTTPDDYHRVATCLQPIIEMNQNKAILVLGHGTSHPSWTAYPALENVLRTTAGKRVYVTGLEKYPGPETVIAEIIASGFDQVLVIPFLMVAGMHFQRDIVGDSPHSWKSRLGGRKIELSFHDQGLGLLHGIADIFCDHIRTALNSASP